MAILQDDFDVLTLKLLNVKKISIFLIKNFVCPDGNLFLTSFCTTTKFVSD